MLPNLPEIVDEVFLGHPTPSPLARAGVSSVKVRVEHDDSEREYERCVGAEQEC